VATIYGGGKESDLPKLMGEPCPMPEKWGKRCKPEGEEEIKIVSMVEESFTFHRQEKKKQMQATNT